MRALVAVSVLALVVGCNKESAPEANKAAGSASAPATASASAPLAAASGSASAGPMHHKKRMGGGVAQMLVNEASELQLDAAKKAKVEDLQKQMRAEMPREEMKALHDEIVAEIKANKIDQAKIDAKQADVEKAMKAHHDKQTDALNQLHATLDEGQRKAVVAKVREDMKKRDERMAKWKEKAKDKEADKDKGKDMKKGFSGHLAKELDLTEAQQKKVEAIAPKDDKAAMPDWDAMKKHEDAILDAFEKDGFDAKKLEMPAEAKKFHGPMDAKFLSQLLPILDQKQRDKLADDMSKMGDMHGKPGMMHGPGMGHGPGMMGPGGAPSGMPDDDDDDDKK
jgi:Spy/CpxP family protein refolding chaperone